MERHPEERASRRIGLAGIGRVALGALLVASTATGAWPACEGSDSAAGAADFDRGPTFGAEVNVTVYGRGRIASGDGRVDCPGKCFARVVMDDAQRDAAPAALPLEPTADLGAHFAGWKLEEVPLGVAARGPSSCSPMTRTSSLVPFNARQPLLALPFGETNGTPPRGHEAECADARRVPVAYVVTATFEEDFTPDPDAGDDAGNTGNEVLFERPAGAVGAAKEIGRSGANLVWRFEQQNGLSGIALGTAPGNTPIVVVSPSEAISTFDVDVHTVFQTTSGSLWVIPAGTGSVQPLGNAPFCQALASDQSWAYCRSSTGGGSRLDAWSAIGVSGPFLIHSLPAGNDLAVDQDHFYFSEDNGGFIEQAIVESAPLEGDGGSPFVTGLVGQQTSPRNLVVGSSYLFWLDLRGAGAVAAVSGSKLGPSAAQLSYIAPSVRVVAADPVLNQAWIGIDTGGVGGSSILRAFGGSTASTVFRAGLTGIGGIAVDTTWVYWTQSDGRVYRALKEGPKL